MQDPVNNVEVIAEDLDKIKAEMNMTSPLDALMNEAAIDDGNGTEDDHENDKQDNDDPFGALDDPFGGIIASPLDSIMNASAPPMDNDNDHDNDHDNDNNEDEKAEKEDDANQALNQIQSPLDAIMSNAILSPSSGSSSDESETPLVPKSNNTDIIKSRMNKVMGHQTIDMDHFLSSSNITHPTMYNTIDSTKEIKEDMEDDVVEEEEEEAGNENEQSLGSEIIHETPRNSAFLPQHEKLDPAIFGRDESDETSSDEDDENSYGTDPNGY